MKQPYSTYRESARRHSANDGEGIIPSRGGRITIAWQSMIHMALLCAVVMVFDGENLAMAAPPADQEASETLDKPLDGRDGRNLALDQFRPVPMVKLPRTAIVRAKFPVVDVHTHPTVRLHDSPQALDDFVRVMDAHQIAVCVSLDGGLGEKLESHQRYLWEKHRDRFVIYANLDFQGQGRTDEPATWDCQRPDFARRMAAQLRAAQTAGTISGLKLFKKFGLGHRNADGSLIKIDDPRFDPIWEACGELRLPVIMHTADPAAFFQPIDEHNERWEELHRHPDWSFHGPQWPTRESLHAARNRVIARHPRTMFIAAHFANDGEDLAQVGQWLDKYPNMVVELASRINELGRQPYTAREFFIRYADRIMFGTDGPRDPARLFPQWRFLETRDEYFPYAENPFPPQGLWNIYGLGLPDDVLCKIYHENAARIIPGVAERLKKFRAATEE